MNPLESFINGNRFSRRTFLKGAAALAATAGTVQGVTTRLVTLAEPECGFAEASGFTGIRYTADVMCPSECGLKVEVKDGVVQTIYGNPDCPFNDGTICAKGNSGKQMVYSPYRLKRPLMRKGLKNGLELGNRGSGEFEEVDWDTAIDYIARKLKSIKDTYGPEAVIVDAGDVTDRDQYWRFAFCFGSPHPVEHGSICDTPRRHGPKLMLGGKRIEPDVMRPQLLRQADGSLVKDYTYRTKLIIFAGWNPFVATRIFYENRGSMTAKVENDCKIIVLDPALSNTAAKATGYTQAELAALGAPYPEAGLPGWLPERPGGPGDTFAAMLRYILDNDVKYGGTQTYLNPGMVNTIGTYQWSGWPATGVSKQKYAVGWDEFKAAFDTKSNETDPINGLKYFSLAWAENRTGIPKEQIANLAHVFGRTGKKTDSFPETFDAGALVWGMQAPGHQYNGYCASILGTVLNIITGNFDAPGGAIDTEITKSSKGSKATGKTFNERNVTRNVPGVGPVTNKQKYLHMDAYGDWPAAWDDVVGDYPDYFDGTKQVKINYGPFKGYEYPIKGYILRTGNSLITGSATWRWKEALTAKDASGKYKLELFVYIDTPYLESGVYADVILPEASYLERMSLSDIYPSEPVIYLRDPVIQPLYDSKKPTEIMCLLAKKLKDLGDPDFADPGPFWADDTGRYDDASADPNNAAATVGEKNFVNQMLRDAPGRNNVGTSDPSGVNWILPYPALAEGVKLIGKPESLSAGINNDYVTVDYLREHNGVAVWTMSWYKYRKSDGSGPSGAWPYSDSKLIEFYFKRYKGYNDLIEATGVVPPGIAALGWTRYPYTFYWFEAWWNYYTNPAYLGYKNTYPFQLICGRVHHAMTGTQMVPWLAKTPVEGTWTPLNPEFEYQVVEPIQTNNYPFSTTCNPNHNEVVKKFRAYKFCIGTILMNPADAGLVEGGPVSTDDLVEIENPLGKKVRSKVVLSQRIRPGVIKMAFGTGGRFSPGLGPTYVHRNYTPDHNMLVDPNCLSPIMGQPAYTNMIVKIRKVT